MKIAKNGDMAFIGPIKESITCKLKNRRISLIHDGEKYGLIWKHLTKDGNVHEDNRIFSAEAMNAIVEMFNKLNGP